MSESTVKPGSQSQSYYKFLWGLFVFLILLKFVIRAHPWTWIETAESPFPEPREAPPAARVAADAFLQRIKEGKVQEAKSLGTDRFQRSDAAMLALSVIPDVLQDPQDGLTFSKASAQRWGREFQVTCDYEPRQDHLAFDSVSIILKEVGGEWKVDDVTLNGGLSL